MKPKVSVWVDKFVPGWNGQEGVAAVMHPTVSVVEALRARYESDAHFVPYLMVNEEGQEFPACPRLKREALPHLPDYGTQVVFDVAVADIDNAEAHAGNGPPSPQWREEMWSKAATLCPHGIIYESLNGLRVVVALPHRMGVDEYQPWTKRWRQWLRENGLSVDEISAWNQPYRAYDVLRNGVRHEELRAYFPAALLPFEYPAVKQEAAPAENPTGIEPADPRQPFKLPRRIPEGQRHQTLVRYAAQLRWQGLEEAAILEQLAEVNAARCRPAAPEAEITEIAQWAAQQESEQQTRERERQEQRQAQGGGDGGEDVDPFALGDHTELAKRIISIVGAGSPVPMVADRNEIMRYSPDTGLWEVVKTHVLEKIAHSFSGVDVRTVMPNGQVGWRPLKVNDNTVTGAIKSVHRLLAQPGFFDAAPAGISLRDCWVRITKDGVEQLPHSPDHRSTVGYNFDWTDEEPEVFYAMMNDYWGHKESCEDNKRAVMEYVGASLCGIAAKYQICLVFRGQGSNGKSTMLFVIIGIFPENVVTSVSAQQFGSETHRAMLANSRLNVVGELPEKKIRQEAAAALKALVSGDEIVAKWLYKDPFRFKPVAGHIVACNTLPEVEDDSDGFFRRFLLIDFDKKFESTGDSRNIGEDVLNVDRARIVCACLRAVPELMRRGRFVQPKESVDEVTAWRHGQDEITLFLEDCTEPCEPVRGNGTDGNTLYTSYVAWAPQNGYEQMNKNRFLKMVDKRRRKFYDNGCARRMYPVTLRR